MVKFDQTIASGETGEVAISAKIYPEWAGQRFAKRAVVYTDDVLWKRFELKMTGFVEEPEGVTESDVIPPKPPDAPDPPQAPSADAS